MGKEARPEDSTTARPDRRALLRTGGVAVAATMAGLAVAEIATAGGASAATGEPVTMGATNDAGTTSTSLTSAGTTGSTLELANTTTLAPLRLVEQTRPTAQPALTSGDLANYGGDLYYATGDPSGPLVGMVYSEVNANQLVPITPQRVLDTRYSGGRAKIVNAAGNLDSAGRLLAGHSIDIDLSSLEFAATAAYCNITIVGPVNGGWLTLWPGGTRPSVSSINFTANAVIANFAVTGTSATDTVTIFASTTTHVLLDVTAFAVANPSQINPSVMPATMTMASQRLATRAKTHNAPSWYSPR